MLNVVLGGTLIQHIPDEIGDALAHEQQNPRDEAGHDVAVVDDMDAVLALHAEVKDVTDLLKGELTTVLALQIPVEASGDND